MVSLRDLEEALRQSWCKETCYPIDESKWTEDNPAFGQCLPTALIVQDYLGGDIVYCSHCNHFWNRLDDRHVDFTLSQFHEGMRLCIDRVVVRQEELEGEWAELVNTPGRYWMLKKKVDKILGR